MYQNWRVVRTSGKRYLTAGGLYRSYFSSPKQQRVFKFEVNYKTAAARFGGGGSSRALVSSGIWWLKKLKSAHAKNVNLRKFCFLQPAAQEPFVGNLIPFVGNWSGPPLVGQNVPFVGNHLT